MSDPGDVVVIDRDGGKWLATATPELDGVRLLNVSPEVGKQVEMPTDLLGGWFDDDIVANLVATFGLG